MNYSDIGDFTYVSLACAFGKSIEAQKRETTDQDNFIVIIGGDSEDKMIAAMLHQQIIMSNTPYLSWLIWEIWWQNTENNFKIISNMHSIIY